MEQHFIVWREGKADKLGNVKYKVKEKAFKTEAQRQAFYDKLRMKDSFVDVQDWRTEIS